MLEFKTNSIGYFRSQTSFTVILRVRTILCFLVSIRMHTSPLVVHTPGYTHMHSSVSSCANASQMEQLVKCGEDYTPASHCYFVCPIIDIQYNVQ